MKLEIIEEKEYKKPTWYILKVNDRTIDCSHSLEEMERHYAEIKNDPNILNISKIVLKSEEITVNL